MLSPTTAKWFSNAVMATGALLLLVFIGQVEAKRQKSPIAARQLFNGWKISPAGEPIALPGDMPSRILAGSDKKHLFVNTAGFNEHGVSVVDLQTRRAVQHIDLAKSWIGLAQVGGTDQFVVSGGGPMPPEPKVWGVRSGFTAQARMTLGDPAYVLGWREDKLALLQGLALPGSEHPRFVSGVASGKNGTLYILDAQNDSVLRLETPGFRVTHTATVGYRPYEAAVSPSGNEVAVSNWGDGSVSLLDAANLGEVARVPVGRFPNQLAYSQDGRLFVANSGANTVSVIQAHQVLENIDVALHAGSPIGSTPDALAINPDGTRLFVANADNNDVAVVDISRLGHSPVLGFIPTAWYPSALGLSRDGKTMYIGAGKGLGIGANVPFVEQPIRLGRPPENLLDNPSVDSKQYNYIGTLFRGFVNVLPVPNAGQLAEFTAQVRANQPSPQAASTLIQDRILSNIKHVVYIVRENRTYDQVFGDMPQGNGDRNLVLFGEKVTPNAHRLASQYVLFDNFFVNGEVSRDGHAWCDYAYVPEYTQKMWMYNYSGRGELAQDGRLSRLPDATLWDLAARFGLDYRSYGEGRTRPSEAMRRAFSSGRPFRDTLRVGAFIEELKTAEVSGKWPALTVMAMPTDHTQGLLPGAYTPNALVADNDLALGQLVEAVSRSRFWKDTAILVVEDDAQDGPDHVDAHRTVALAISPYIRRGAVDHTQYTQVSLVRTIELILGLPALSQYDEAATPLFNALTDKPDFTGYVSVKPNIDMQARNPKEGAGAVASLGLDFSGWDRADPAKLNAILWQALRPGQAMPVSVHAAFFKPAADDDGETKLTSSGRR